MDPLPLIPKSKIPESHDTSHVIREVFRNINAPIFPKNVCENVQKFNLQNKNLKESGIRVDTAYNSSKLSMQDIDMVENQLMLEQGKRIQEQYIINRCECFRARMKLKRTSITSDLPEKKYKQYGLIQSVDLLPKPPERSMDFRVNSNKHRCTNHSEIDLKLTLPVDLTPKYSSKIPRKRMKQSTKPQERAAKVSNGIKDESEKDKYTKARDRDAVIFRAEPDKILFEEYEVGVLYEKTLKLRNVTSTLQSLAPPSLKNSSFKLHLLSSSTRVAAGMCVVYSVRYCTEIYRDAEETLRFNTFVGKDVEVRVKSSRRPPRLLAFVFRNLDHFFRKYPLFGSGQPQDPCRALAVNSTIDCGSCLLGYRIGLSLILKNEGNMGRFFLVTEDDWYFSEISTVSKGLDLTTECFRVHPTYFEINRNELVELDITFFPVDCGLEVEKMFLVCNNNTIEEIELIGDGVPFEPNSVVIEAATKIQGMMDMDAEATYMVSFEKCIANRRITRSFLVHNNRHGRPYLAYQWEMRESVCHIQGTILLKLNPKWVSLDRPKGVLPSQSTTAMEVALFCPENVSGLYSLVYTLYILDVPEISLDDNKTFETVEKPPLMDCQIVDVIVGEIEILCEIIPTHVEIDPAYLLIPYPLGYAEQFEQKIQLYSDVPFGMDCEWKNPSCTVEVTPEKFYLHSGVTCVCTLKVTAVCYEDIQEQLKLSVNGGFHERVYDVIARKAKPAARFSADALNFGCFPKGRKPEAKTFYVENLHEEPLDWEIYEFCFDETRSNVYELDTTRHLDITKGRLEKNASCAVTYSVESCHLCHRWLSFLLLFSSHPTCQRADCSCMVTYEVAQPELILHTSSSHQPILCPNKILFTGMTSYFLVCLHNIGSKLPGSFVWGKPVGSQAKWLDVKCTPRSGVVQPESCVHVTLALTPVKTGILDELFVPCFVGNMDEPLMLTVLCVVENVYFYVHLPMEDGHYKKVFWPPRMEPDFKGTSLEFALEEDRFSFRSDLFNSFALMPPLEEKELDHEQVQEEETLSDFCTPWPELFGSELVLHDNILEYKKVPLFTPVKKTIILENLTPLEGYLHLGSTNFSPVPKTEERQVDNLLVKLKYKARNEWEEIVGQAGVVVKITPTDGVLPAHKSVEVDIWVYANTWGFYIEEVVLEVNELTSFCFNLFIEVVGIPIEFPIIRTANTQPVIRFGNVPYWTKTIERKLKITNTSSIPFGLIWNIYTTPTDTNKRSNSSESQPSTQTSITLVGPPCSDDDCDDHDKVDESKVFEVMPPAVTIDPKSSECITVRLNPENVVPKFRKSQVETTLIGYVYLHEAIKFQPSTYYRPTDVNVQPVRVTLQATLELPLLKFELVKGDMQVKVFATDVIEAQEMRFRKTLVFKNRGTAPAAIFMHTKSPFRVMLTRTCNSESKKNAAEVKPGECVEVLLECFVDVEEVMHYSDMLFNEKTTVYTEIPDFKNKSISLLRYLNIHQHGLKKQITPLQLVIFYPDLQISHHVIDFGVVYVGNTKRMLFTLSNKTACKVPFTIHVPLPSSGIIVKPTSGVIPNAQGITSGKIIVKVYFIPKECRVYQETIRVFTSIPFLGFTVLLAGTGSINEKFYIEGM